MADTPFNGLTSAQAERLAILAEEAGEIVQAVGKILLHGYDSCHPDEPGVTNKQLLRKEIVDLHAVEFLMSISNDLNPEYISREEVERSAEKKLRYSHHQYEEPSIILFRNR